MLTGGKENDVFSLTCLSGFAKVTDFNVKKEILVTRDKPNKLSWAKDKHYFYLYDANNNLITNFRKNTTLVRQYFHAR